MMMARSEAGNECNDQSGLGAAGESVWELDNCQMRRVRVESDEERKNGRVSGIGEGATKMRARRSSNVNLT
jgi:hypothetical protein